MIIDERLFTFINSFDKGNSEFLDELEKEAKRDLCTDYPSFLIAFEKTC